MTELLDFSRLYPFRGQTWPLRRDQVNDFASATEVELINADIALLLGVECTGQNVVGELPWRPELGSLLFLLKHRLLTDPMTLEFARVYSADAVAKWYPAVRVTGVEITTARDPDGVENRGVVRIKWAKFGRGSSQVLASGVAELPVSG